MVLCKDCRKEIEPNKIQINEYLIVDLCPNCLKKYDPIALKKFKYNRI
jgi:uncharacterized CHY-type Zn-finger protein